MEKVALKKIVDDMELELVVGSKGYEDIEITKKETNLMGLQLTGYLEGFPYDRIQIVGSVETSYYKSLETETKLKRFSDIFSFDIPCIIFTNGYDIPDEILELARKMDKTIIRSEFRTSKLIGNLMDALDLFLALETTLHANLVEVYGMGILIRGDSSVGKSETALDLVTRGHRLVADDVVDIIKLDQELLGQSPENIRHFLEIRGLGILDIKRLYGLGSVKTSASIDLVIQLESWDDDTEYDRLGIEENYTEILGVQLPYLLIPVKQGRNLAMIVEVAARNARQRYLGYNAALELNKKLKESMKQV